MKVAERLIEKEGALQGERVGMTIDTDALSHIMSVLTDLYSDPEAAVIREYSTNALDSHIEAGQTRPIEVTTPGDLTPYLRIRDYGIGLDADGIRDIYSRYGTSTKRDSDDVVGMLGLGCKSALTYCDQFTLVGIKDGTMTTVAVGRDEDGSGTMTIVDVSPTTEPNGLEVVIPAKRGNTLRQKAVEFFGFWTPGTVLVNGTQPEQHDKTWIVEGRIALTTAYNRPVVVMGNVAYPISDEQAQGLVKLPRETHPMFFVDIGEVNFTPSREALQSTRRTRETLAALFATLEQEYHEGLARSIREADTHVDAVAAWIRASALGLPKSKALWKGAEVVTTIDRQPYDPRGNRQYIKAEDRTDSILVAMRHPNGYRGSRKSGDRMWEVPVVTQGRHYNPGSQRYEDGGTETIVFIGHEGKTFTETKRAKVEALLALSDNRQQRWLLFDKLTKDEARALDGHWIVKWEDVEAIKLTGPRAGKKIGGSYPGTRPVGGTLLHEKEIPADEIPQDGKVLWVRANYWYTSPGQYERLGLPKDHYLIGLTENRVAKFRRDFPKAVEVGVFVKAQARKVWESFDKDARLAGALTDSSIPHWIKQVGNTADDPRVKRLHELSIHPKRAAAGKAAERYRQTYGESPAEYKEVHTLIDGINKAYPLLASIRYDAPKEHIILYVNAARAAEGK